MPTFNTTKILGDLRVTGITNLNEVGAFTLNGQLTSTLTTGTAPFVVTSTTPVENLGVRWTNVADKPTIPTIPSIMTETEGNTGTATTQRTINAANLKSIILNHSPAGARPASDVHPWAKKSSLAIEDIPTGTTESTVALGNHIHSQYLTSFTETDPTVPEYVKSITPGDISSWNGKQSALGYTPENIANKRTSIRVSGADDTSYVSELGVKTYVDGLIGSVYRPAGDWNANTNSPTLENNTLENAGKVYRVSVAGTQFGFTFDVGDKLAFNESGVISKWDNVDDVVSVNGQTGAVVLTTDDVTQGSNLYVSQSEKDTWNSKQSSITGAATTITSSNLTTNRALISNGSGKVAVSAVTSTELGYLSGVTSSIQGQLNSKLSTSGGTLTGDLTSNGSILMPFRGTAGTDRIYQELQGVSANDSTNENSGAFIRFRTSTSAGYGADIGAYRRAGGASALIIKTGGQNPTESVRVDENKNLIVQGGLTVGAGSSTWTLDGSTSTYRIKSGSTDVITANTTDLKHMGKDVAKIDNWDPSTGELILV